MKKNNKSILILVTLIFILISFLVNVELIINNIINYTNIFFNKLFPVSFITYLIVYMLIEYGLVQFINKYLKITSCNIFLFILSFISGFPSGAKYSKLLYDKNLIKKEDINSLIKFTHFPNLLFLFGAVREIINDLNLTFYLFLAILLSNCSVMLFSKKTRINIDSNIIYNSFSKVLGSSVIYSFKTLLLIYGTSLFFYLISSVIFIDNLYLNVLFNGIFDLTNGIVSSGLINNTFIRCIFILIFLSFGSISIHMQVNEILNDKYIYFSYLKGRIICCIISIFIFSLLFFY